MARIPFREPRGQVGPLAVDAVLTLAQALVRVEAGSLGVLAFGGDAPEVHRQGNPRLAEFS